jgi:hypothetical protein
MDQQRLWRKIAATQRTRRWIVVRDTQTKFCMLLHIKWFYSQCCGSGLQIRIRMFLGLPDPDPLVRGTDPDPALDPSVIKQK